MKRVTLYGGNIEIDAFTDPGEKHEYKIAKSAYGHKVGEKIPAVPGVTTALGVINKPALISWAANMTIVNLLARSGKITKQNPLEENTLSLNQYMEFAQREPDTYGWPFHSWSLKDLNEARGFHKRYKEAAGERGTDAHNMIAKMIKHFLKDKLLSAYPSTAQFFVQLVENNLSNLMLNVRGHVQSFVAWCKYNPSWEIVSSESVVFSAGTTFCGTLDLKLKALCYMEHPHADGNTVNLEPVKIQPGDEMIVDFKTSGGIWPDMRLQVSAYAAAEAEEKELTTGKEQTTGAHRAILHLQADGSPAILFNYGPENYGTGAEDYGSFLHCLGLYRWIRKNGWNQKNG